MVVADGSIASQAERKGLVCQQDENSLGGQIKGHSEPNLPEVQNRILMIVDLCYN